MSIEKTPSAISLLLLGALRGLVSITEDLSKKGTDVNASDGEYGSALQAASICGHNILVQMLLEKEQTATCEAGGMAAHCKPPLLMATRPCANTSRQRSRCHMSDRDYGSALQAASIGGHEAVVQKRLDKGADVNAPGGEYGNALQAASYHVNRLIVQLLLEKGPDINTSSGEHGSALQLASSCDYKSVVQLLLDQGADVHV